MKKFLFPKIFVVFFSLFGFSLGVSAQIDAFNNGDMIINVGVGIGTYINHNLKLSSGDVLFNEYNYSMTIPPITGSFEYGVLDLFDGKGGVGIGGYLAYILFKGRDRNHTVNDFNLGDFIIGPRGLFHYQFVDKLDTYAGVMVGYDIVSYSQAGAAEGSKFCSAFFVGARYYITNNIGVFGELGYGVSPLQLGLCYKF